MPKLAWTVALGLIAAIPAAAETAVPDLRGTWKETANPSSRAVPTRIMPPSRPRHGSAALRLR